MAAKKAAVPTNSASKSKAVATIKSGGAIVAAGADFSQYAGAGTENITAQDLLIPRLTLLQSLSPQIIKSKPEFIQGAQVGDICDVGLGEIIESPLIFLPVMFSKVWIEWKPKRAGLAQIHNTPDILNDCASNENRDMIVQSGANKGNIVIETAQFFGLNLSAGGRRSFIPMAVTQMKSAKTWNGFITNEKLTRADGSSYTPPIFYRSYSLSAVEKSNEQGTWFVWKVERHLALPEMEDWDEKTQSSPTFQDALQFMQSVQRGDVRGDVGAAPEENADEAM